MTERTEDHSEENMRMIVAYIATQIQAGITDRDEIAHMLQSQFPTAGIDDETARKIIDHAYITSAHYVESKQVSFLSIMLGAVGGFLCASIAAIIWILVAVVTDYELGIIAIVVGYAAGFGVLISTKGKDSGTYQIVAMLTGALGVLIGKYGIFIYYH